MSEEAAFLELLKANPADDTTRLVYADWLDDHDEPAKAEYLRQTRALVIESVSNASASRVRELGEIVPEEWKVAAASRFDIVVHTCGAGGVIQVIKGVRELTGANLGEMKWFIYNLPQAVFRGVPPDTALVCRDYLQDTATGADVRITASELHRPPALDSSRFTAGTKFQIQASPSLDGPSDDNPAIRQAANSAVTDFLTEVMEPGDRTVEQHGTVFFLSSPLHPAPLLRRLRFLRQVAKQHSGEGWTIYVKATQTT